MLKRIAFLNPQGNFDAKDRYWTEHPDFGGQLVYVKEVAMQVAKKGIFADILTRRIVDPKRSGFEGETEKYPDCDRCTIVRLRFGGDQFLDKERLWPHIADYARAVIAYYRQIDKFPDVLTGHYADGGLAAAIISRETGIPFTFTAHSLGAQKIDKIEVTKENFVAMEEKYCFSRRIEAERTAMKYAHRCIGSTDDEWEKQYSHSLYRETAYGVRQNFITIAPGVNTDIFAHKNQNQDNEYFPEFAGAIARDIASQRRNLPLALCASRPDPKKNQIGLLKAFVASTSLTNSANAAFVFRGISDPLGRGRDKSPMLAELVDFIHANGLEGSVVFFDIESQKALASLYRFCAKNRGLFTLLAFYEPFGLAPLEAMACGLPVVITENGGPREVLAGGEYGILVAPDNPGNIAKGLLKLLGSEKWQDYREKGMRRVHSHYTWQKCAENYIALCREITGEKTEGIAIHSWFFDPITDDASLVKSLRERL